MTVPPEALRFDADCMWVDLSDGRTISVPLAWFPRLFLASPACLAGRGDRMRAPRRAA